MAIVVAVERSIAKSSSGSKWRRHFSSANVSKCRDYLIRSNTVICNDHLTPEIKLHLITPECHLWREDGTKSPFESPFWAFYWPGGQALARYILDNREVVANKRVLDIGTGSGAVAIAAALAGASSVVANDIDPDAIRACLLNASLNRVNVKTSRDNWIRKVDGAEESDIFSATDVLTFGDMFYDYDFAKDAIRLARKLATSGKQVYIGDPGRVYVKETEEYKHLKCLQCYDLPRTANLENHGFTQGFVYEVQGND